MTATGTTASGSVWSPARRQVPSDDASSRARPQGRDEARESPPPADIHPRMGTEKIGGGAVGGMWSSLRRRSAENGPCR